MILCGIWSSTWQGLVAMVAQIAASPSSTVPELECERRDCRRHGADFWLPTLATRSALFWSYSFS